MDIKTTIKQQLVLTVMSTLVGLLLGGFLINRYAINQLKEDSELMKVKWDVMLQMSSPEAREDFNENVSEELK